MLRVMLLEVARCEVIVESLTLAALVQSRVDSDDANDDVGAPAAAVDFRFLDEL